MNRNQTATNRDIMMRFQARHYSAYMQPLFVQSERPLSVFTPETGPQLGGAHHAIQSRIRRRHCPHRSLHVRPNHRPMS